MHLIANTMIVLTATSALVFVVLYAWLAPWRGSAYGRHVMAFMVVILIEGSLATASVILGTHWLYRDLVRAIAWALVLAMIVWRIVLLIRAQLGDRKKD